MPNSPFSVVSFPSPDTASRGAEAQAYRFLRDAICSGELQPGERLVTEDMAKRLQMSRMPVREAIRQLAAEGMVRIRPNRGAVVTQLNVDDMREIFEMRSALEGLAARLAAPKITDRDLKVLARQLEDMDACEASSAEWVVRHRVFHETICGLAGRPRLMQQIASLYALLEPYMRIWLRHCDKVRTPHAAHAHLLQAFASRDARHAEQVLCSHIEGTVPMLLSFWQERQLLTEHVNTA